MAEGDITFYNLAKKKILDGTIVWNTDTIKVALVTGYTPNIDTHEFWSTPVANEETGTGYTAGGITLTSKATTLDAPNDQIDVTAGNVTWAGLNVGTPGHAIIYKSTGVNGTSPLIAYIELGVTPTNGGDYTLQWNAGGVFTLT